MGMPFSEIRRAVPKIHVFEPGDKGGVTLLEPQESDERHEIRRYGEGYVEGDGSRKNPYRYLSAAPVSPHYIVVDLWLMFRDAVAYIQANDWLLEVAPEGVTALDGHFTKFV